MYASVIGKARTLYCDVSVCKRAKLAMTHLVDNAAVHGLFPLLLLEEEDGGSLSLLPWSGGDD